MKTHPSEAELQEFALERSKSKILIAEHISSCEQCKATVAIYQQLVLSIGQQEKPSFDFNLAQLVLRQLPSPQKSYSRDNIIFYTIALVVFGLSGIICYWFSEFFAVLLLSFGSLFMYLLSATAMVILIFQGLDIYKRYQHKIKILDFIDTATK